jgi:hypothetical protein
VTGQSGADFDLRQGGAGTQGQSKGETVGLHVKTPQW